jgi:hypothetical protein
MNQCRFRARDHDLRQTAVVTMLFTTFFSSMPAALRLATDSTDR